MKKKQAPILSGALFCNSASPAESGKLDCRGIFTTFLVWAYPTSLRLWHAILTLHNLPEGTSSVTAAISFGRGKKISLATVNIRKTQEGLGNVISIPLGHRFKREGIYMLHFNLVGSKASLKVPVQVKIQPWPRFTKKQLEFLKKNHSIPHSLRMNVLCSECSRPYVFEETVLADEPLAGGVFPFPESGLFECESCRHKMHLKDIQGQLRSSIRMAVLNAMKGRK
jgi:hypothetical protein